MFDGWFGCFMVFDANFNNISVISWQSILLVEETGENHWPVVSLSHNVVLSIPHHEQGSNSQFKRWWALIAQVVVNPTTIQSQVRQPQHVLNSPCNFLTMWYNSHVLYGSLSLQTYLYFHKVSYCWNHMIHCHGMQVRSGMPESIINYTHLFHNKIKRRSQLNSFIKMG